MLDAASEGGVDAVLEKSRPNRPAANAPRRTGDLANGFVRAPAIHKGSEVIGVHGVILNGTFWIVEARHPSQAGFARRAADTVYPTLTDEIKTEVAEVKFRWHHGKTASRQMLASHPMTELWTSIYACTCLG